MITEKNITNSRRIITKLIQEGTIVKSSKKFSDFFLKKSEGSLKTAKALNQISINKILKEKLGLPNNFDAYVWVVNSSYYSMFYAATSLLAHFNHRIKQTQGIHSLTYHALVYYFLDNDKKLQKHILEEYKSAESQASEILQMAEKKAKSNVEEVKYELNKRRIFTYEMGKIAEKNKASTSVQRAENFLTLVKEPILE